MLPAPHRLKGKKIFDDLFRMGKTFSNDALMMKVSEGKTGQPTKFGFGASLKFSKKAVERNKVKRWMREAVRAKIGEIQLGWHVIFFINPRIPKEKLNLELVQKKTENLLKKAKIYPHTNSKNS
jgi:ribonuclease P protein component